jgi:hypothetical protein
MSDLISDERLAEIRARATACDGIEVVVLQPHHLLSLLARLDKAEGIGGGIRETPAPAKAAVVKPLEWVEDEQDWWSATAFSYLAGYETWATPRGVVRWRRPGQAKFELFDGTLDEAKAAAQRDYEARILSCLVSSGRNLADATPKAT